MDGAKRKNSCGEPHGWIERLRGRNAEVGSLGRVSAAEIESAIFTTIQSYRGQGDSDARTDPFRDVERVVLARDQLLITTVGSGGAEGGRDPRGNKSCLAGHSEEFGNLSGKRRYAGGRHQ